ncbi:MAG TPA: HD domain-containing phosphohydrolase [Thermoanaerobaculia bacterium]|nr:HD domain-containing phosphohydrolase [Thermoanaerobaculia bacterium]HUM30243.1 HD domain-containing phosphohydrolase [Thermoanaerobaculia bacterium]HXK68461.1 HD domain-containing phosphohydrolase [Thermoanaerobaculia bacterium]
MDVNAVDLKYKEILYACLEEMKATKAALYLMESDGDFHLKTYYGFTKSDLLTERHTKDSHVVQLIALERKPFCYNNLTEAMNLAPLLTKANTTRILIAPIYLDRIVGFLDVRDKAGKAPFEDQDLIVADGIAMRYGRMLKQIKQKVEEDIHRSIQRDSIPIPAPGTTESIEDLQVRIGALITSPSERVLHPVSQPPQEFARTVRACVDGLMPIRGFATMVVIFQTARGTFMIQGGRTPLPGGSLQKLKDEAVSYAKGQVREAVTGEGFFSHRYFPEGEQAPSSSLRRQANVPVLLTPWARIFFSVFSEENLPSESITIIQGLLPSFKRSLMLELSMHLEQQTLEYLLEKFIDPGLDRFSSLKIHSVNVSRLAHEFCLQLQINQIEIDRITTAALLHDVGMRELDYDKLYHKKRLSDSELQLLKQHPKVGAYILQDIPFASDVYSLVFYHHERYDGTGYPGQLMGQDIPLGARIIHIIEAWDAMTSRDSYRPTLSPGQTIEILRSKAGIQFDPDLVQRFITFVQARNLVSGETGGDTARFQDTVVKEQPV